MCLQLVHITKDILGPAPAHLSPEICALVTQLFFTPRFKQRGTLHCVCRYMDDIEAAKQLGCTSMRVSLEWSRIQPYSARHVDEDAVTRYKVSPQSASSSVIMPCEVMAHLLRHRYFLSLLTEVLATWLAGHV